MCKRFESTLPLLKRQVFFFTSLENNQNKFIVLKSFFIAVFPLVITYLTQSRDQVIVRIHTTPPLWYAQYTTVWPPIQSIYPTPSLGRIRTKFSFFEMFFLRNIECFFSRNSFQEIFHSNQSSNRFDIPDRYTFPREVSYNISFFVSEFCEISFFLCLNVAIFRGFFFSQNILFHNI